MKNSVLVMTVSVMFSCSSAQGTFHYTETFSTDTASFPGSDPNYSEWQMLYPIETGAFDAVDPTDPSTYSLTPTLGPTSASVVGGQLQFNNPLRFSSTFAKIDIPNSSRVTMTADIGALSGASAYTGPGFFVGNLGFRFNPGFSGGALGLQNINTGLAPSDLIHMGFTPGFGTMSQLSVDVWKTGETTATADFTLASGSNVFTRTVHFTDVKDLNVAGFLIVNDGTPVFDNLSITAEPIVNPVPVPTSLILLCLGVASLTAARLRRRTTLTS